MMKNEFVGILNCLVSMFIGFGTPLLTFALPIEFVVHGYFFIVVLFSIMHTIDMLNSDCTKRNVAIMRKAGFDNATILGSALSTLFGFQIPGILLTLYCMDYNPDWEIPTWEYFSMDKLTMAFIMVLSTDGLFYVMHKFLHERLPRVHLLHHCCIYSSLTTNLFFHPLDLAIEFSGPTLAVFFVSKYFMGDPWMFALSSAIISAWYISDHDEWIASAHTKHHRGCATNYFAYKNYFYADEANESVRKFLPKLSKSDGLKEA